MAGNEEKAVITEIIELYKHLPCLWDPSCEGYKNKKQKTAGWEYLVTKFKKIQPDANMASVKKKIDNLKASYKREVKKVKDSKKRTGFTEGEVHKPNLWYYNLMTFMDKKYDQLPSGVSASFSSEDESLQGSEKRRRHSSERPGDQTGRKRGHQSLERKTHDLIETAQDLLRHNPKKLNPFGVYVGEKLDSLSTYQRTIAEKLISEIIFLAKTENLDYNSRIESSTRQRPTFVSHCSRQLSSPQCYSPSSQYNCPSPQYVSTPKYSPKFVVQSQLSPQYESSHSSPSFLHVQVPSPPKNVNSYIICQSPHSPEFQSPSSSRTVQPAEEIAQNVKECPTSSRLKELLIVRTE